MKWFNKFKALFAIKSKKNKIPPIDFTEIEDEELIAWWGNFLVNEEQSRYIKIAQIVVCIDHFNQEWRIACQSDQNPLQTPSWALRNQSDEISIKPTLPDRALLSPLERALFVPAQGELLLYVRTPVWIVLSIGTPPLTISEIASQTLSDTWDGKNTLEGELCYAGQPQPLIRLEDLPRDTEFVISPVLIVNRDREAIMIQQLKLPLPQLSVYQDSQNQLWTEQILMTFEDGIHSTTILRNASEVKELTLLTPARHEIKQRFKGLFASLRK